MNQLSHIFLKVNSQNCLSMYILILLCLMKDRLSLVWLRWKLKFIDWTLIFYLILIKFSFDTEDSHAYGRICLKGPAIRVFRPRRWKCYPLKVNIHKFPSWYNYPLLSLLKDHLGLVRSEKEKYWLRHITCISFYETVAVGKYTIDPLVEFCHYLSFVIIRVLSQFEFSHNLIVVTIWVLSQIKFCHNLSFVKIPVLSHFEFCWNLSYYTVQVLSQFKFCDNLSFVTILVWSQISFFSQFQHNCVHVHQLQEGNRNIKLK